jgi:glycosyltransferase involved in cell wall biosynthesis
LKLAIISVRAASLLGFRGPLIRMLVEKNIEVFALASDYDDSSRAAVTALGAKPIDITLTRTGMNPFEDFLNMLRLARILRRLKPDVSFGYYIKPVIFGTVAAWRAGVPHRVALIEGLGFVFTEDGKPLSIKRKILRIIVSSLYRFALSKAHNVVFLNADDIRDFDRWGIVAQEKSIELGGIGVDLEEWAFTAPQADTPRFLFIGRLLAEKGLHDFIAAARSVKAAHPRAQFIVLGDVDSNPGGIGTAQMQAWVDEGLITWPGHVAVQPWLQACSVFVLPSYREGVPRSTQEAMAIGRPIITTDAPGCRQTVDEGVNGYLVPVRNPEALAHAMLRFIEQPELIAQMGKESRRLAEERFDVHKVNAKLMEILGF